MTGPLETEVKIRLPNKTDAESRLQQAGFRESVPRLFESNTVYDTADSTLRSAGTLLRLRQVGERAILTWKGVGTPGPHKSRPELETSVGSHDILHAILTEIGFRPSFRYEKFRTEYKLPDSPGVVTCDETPIGFFLEIEGPSGWIDETAGRLGFSPNDYILDSYGKLYLRDCQQRSLKPADMVFDLHR